MFVRAPAHGERHGWVTMGEAAAGNLQERTGLKTYPEDKKKKKKDKKDKAVGRLGGRNIASVTFQPPGIVNLLLLKSPIAFLSALRSSVKTYRSDLGWDRVFV